MILGGTGAMGMHLVQLLADNGMHPVVTSRTKRASEGTVQYVQGNAHDLNFLQPLLNKHWDLIVDFMIYSTAVFEKRVNLLLNATSQYIFLSSARVYADSDCPIDETSSRLLDVSSDKDFLATDEYSLTKARQEDLLIRTGRLNWTIIRPYITYSENRLQLGVLEKEEWLYRALHGRTIVVSEDINSKLTTMTYGLDVSKSIMAIIGYPCALGEVFNITSGRSVSWADVLSFYIAVLENHLREKPKVRLVNMTSFMRCKNVKYQINYDRLFNRTFDNSKIAQHIVLSDFMEIKKGITTCLEQFLRNPQFKGIDWVAEAMKDKQTKECASLREIPGIKNKIRYLRSRFC